MVKMSIYHEKNIIFIWIYKHIEKSFDYGNEMTTDKSVFDHLFEFV